MNDHIYKQLIEQSPLGCSFHKTRYKDEGNPYDCEFVEVNHAFEKLTGLKKEDVIGRSIGEVFLENNKGEHDRTSDWKRIINNDEIKEFEYFHWRVGKWLRINVCFRNKDYCIMSFADITHERNQISELTKSNKRLENIIEGTSTGTWEWNIQTGETIFNERWAEMIGYTLEEISPISIATWKKYTYSDDVKQAEHLLRKVFAGEKDNYEIECRMKHKDGSVVWIQDRGRVTSWTPNGKPLLMSGSHTDITEKKKAENTLTERTTLLSEAMHISKIGSWKWDLNTKQIFWSEEMYEIFGIDKSTVIGRLGGAISSIVHPDDLHIFEDTIALSERKPFEYRIILPDHSIRHILAKTGDVTFDESLNPIFLIGIVQDITEQKKIQLALIKAKEETEEANQYLVNAQKEISYQKELLESVIENIPHPLSIYDNRGNLIKRNVAGREFYPDSVERKTIKDEHDFYEYFDLDGTMIPAKDLPSCRASRGEIVKNQVVVIRRGDFEQITEATAAPIFDEDNNLISFILFHRVITEFIEHQRLIKDQQEQLLKTEKDKIETLKDAIRVKDEFFSLISHEFKTPITIIDTTIQVMELICINELSDKAKGYLNKIRRNVNRQLRLVNNLLDITRMETGHLKINKRNIDIIYLTKAITESISIFALHKNIELIFLSAISEKIIYIDDEKVEISWPSDRPRNGSSN